MAEKLNRDTRLNKWISNLDRSTLDAIAFEIIDRMIEIEEINMYSDDEAPYWEGNGERLDEADRDEDDGTS